MTARGRDAEVAGFFDTFAGDYDQAYGRDTVGGRILRRRLETALGMLGDGPGGVLDAGMGGGVLCARLAARGWTVSGVDVSPAMVELARARLPEHAERLRVGSVLALPFADASFDAAVCTGVLEYVDAEVPRAVAELARAVRPGGTVVASLPNYRSVQGIWRFRLFYPSVRHVKRLLRRTPPPSRRIVTLQDVRDAFEAAGLTVQRVETLGVRALPRAVGRRLEGSRSALARAFATQYVLHGRKAAR